jgi:hypothetical protein
VYGARKIIPSGNGVQGFDWTPFLFLLEEKIVEPFYEQPRQVANFKHGRYSCGEHRVNEPIVVADLFEYV